MADLIRIFYAADLNLTAIEFFLLTLGSICLAGLGCWLVRVVPRWIEAAWANAAEQAWSPVRTVTPRKWHDLAHLLLLGGCATVSTSLYGVSTTMLVLCLACSALLLLARIDAYTGLLPDILTLSLLWGGLLFHLEGWLLPLKESVLGAVFGYLPLWALQGIAQRIVGRPVMGYGDFKLTAALGAWVGVTLLPWLLLTASCLACLCVLVCFKRIGQRWRSGIPFGPFLAFAGILAIFTCLWPVS